MRNLKSEYHISMPDEWPLNRQIRINNASGRCIGNYVFRWPILVIALACFAAYITTAWISWVTTSILLLAIFLQLILVFKARLTFGYLDTFFLLSAIPKLFPKPSIMKDDLTPSRSQQFGFYVRLFAVLSITIMVAFAGIYATIDQSTGCKAFDGVSSDCTIIFRFLYFSIVTMGTVGYGDIKPLYLSAQLIVAIQILISFTLVVLVLTAFSLTVETAAPEISDDLPVDNEL